MPSYHKKYTCFCERNVSPQTPGKRGKVRDLIDYSKLIHLMKLVRQNDDIML